MKYIAIPLEEHFPYRDDVQRIVRILAEREIICSEKDAHALWDMYSDSMAASWMGMDGDDDDTVFACIANYVDKFTV
jgi:hypothetical protein